MSFVDFSRISSAKPDLNRNEKFSIPSIDIKGKSGHYDFHSASDLTPIKTSGTPNSKALKWFGIALGVIVSVALVITLIACLVVFLGNGEQNNGNNSGITTLRYQKDKISSTPLPSTSVSSGIPLTTTKATETASTVTTKEMSTETTKTESTLSTANLQKTSMTQPLSSTSSPTTIVNGTWSNWGPWTMCAVTCGNSIHSRYRTCIKSTANDSNCVGNFKQQEECTATACLVYGTWTTWQQWSNCDVSCGGGAQNRSRTCMKISNTDIDCVGRSTQQKTCSDWACPDCSTVCNNGTLNSECDACECSSDIYGLVRNSNGGLLNNVTIALELAPYRQLTTTKENGTFELNNVCSQHRIILKRLGYQDTTVKILSSPVFVTMDSIQYPVITTQPKSHLRLEGESVEFCCNATGNPAITSYEWLKNGNLLNDSFNPEGSTLTLTDLKFADSGNVVCRANSPAGAIFSDTVYLSVRANSDDFCSDAYETYEINLPYDCIQTDTNSTKYDIGKCLPKPCMKNSSNVAERCSVDKKFCCSPRRREKQIIQCTGYSFPLYVTTSCTCGECEDTNITLNGQAVGATSGLPLRFGTIEIDGNLVGSTGIFGDFSFTVPRGTTRIAVVFKDTYFNQFLDTLKIIHLNEELSGSFNIHVSMIEKSTPIDIISNVSNTLQIGNQDGAESIASLTIPANSIFYPNGTRYDGDVKASIIFFDPRNSSSIENAPGEFVFINEEGQTQNLQSFGVLSLSLQDQSGSSLQIAGETEITLDQTFFESTSIGNLTDAKLWGLNSLTGIWEELAPLRVISSKRKKRQSKVLVGTVIVSQVPWINLDVPFTWTDCFFKTQVYHGNLPIPNYNVRVIYWTTGGRSVIGSPIETLISNDMVVTARCMPWELKGYITVENDNKNIPVDRNNSGLISSAEKFIGYNILEDGRTVSSNLRMSDSGPFYTSRNSNFTNIFRFKYESTDFALKVLNPSVQEALEANPLPQGNEVWYPPLFSTTVLEGRKYRACFIKIGTENANQNLVFRVTSQNENMFTMGIHEKGLTSGSTCIEYRCSVKNPDYDINKIVGSDFYRYDQTYTLVRIIPIGQVCSVSSESNQLRTGEQAVMNFSTPMSNIGDTYFDAYIPHIQYEGIYFYDEEFFNKMNQARNFAINKCNVGGTTSGDKNMIPHVGLATKFSCL